METKTIVVIVLTFNSEETLSYLIDVAGSFAETIWVVDSFSGDHTEEIARSRGCHFVQHAFENYGAQRRWAESHIAVSPGQWILHLDSDEIPDRQLSIALQRTAEKDDPNVDGYLIRRLSYFWGHPIRYGHMNPSWHLRFFRSGKGACEDRLYDQHFVCSGPTLKLPGKLLDIQLTDLAGWTASHNRWSSAEAEEALRNDTEYGTRLTPKLSGDLREKKRWLKEKVWYRLPLFIRPTMLFFYSYVLKGGFLDGRAGLVYHVLHAFWFRFLIDAKILETTRYSPQKSDRISKEWLRREGVNLE